MFNKKLSIIIPCYNEKKTILKILKRVEAVDLSSLNCQKEIIIVDDYSTDGTREILKELEKKYKIIYQQKNQGKGMAIREGIKETSGDIILIQDADLEYEPNDYPALIKPILENKSEVVYGSRILGKNPKRAGLIYYLGGRFLTFLTNILYGTKITDEPTCYKVFKAKILKSIDLKCQGFEFCPEVTAKVARKKIKIQEVPIKYYPRTVKEGKKIKWRDGIKAVLTLLKYRFFE